MHPTIAISFQVEDNVEAYSIQRGYIDFVTAFGGIPIMLPPQANAEAVSQVLDIVDGVLIPGGDDIDPALYGQERTSFKDKPKVERDAIEPYLVLQCAERNIPYLGICRGLQIMNVAFGGTLCQSIADLPGDHLEHWQHLPFQSPSHSVETMTGTLVADVFGAGKIRVNSIHHQAVDRIGSGLSIGAVSEDGIAEALSLLGKDFFVGVQWHPELDAQAPFSKSLGRAFVEASRKRMEQRLA